MKQDTKEKILIAARKLFAEHGYNATSVRDIASRAEVNIAAINYHFKDKQTLYWTVFESSYLWLKNKIEEICTDASDIESVMWDIFSFLSDQSTVLRNVFLILLSDSFPLIDPKAAPQFEFAQKQGPPGVEAIEKILRKEVPKSIDHSRLTWATESMFAQVVHWALMVNGKNCQQMHAEHPMMGGSDQKRYIVDHTRAIVGFLKGNR